MTNEKRNIRLMTKDDFDGIYAVWISCPGMGLNNIDDTYEGIAKFIDRNPENSFVAEVNGKIIGGIMVGNDGKRGYIYHTAILEEYRGKGIGKALVQAAIEALRDMGIIKVNLTSFTRNIDGNAFWSRMGFRIRDDLYYRDYIIMDYETLET